MKNAIDFDIAVCIGSIINSTDEEIAIISNDTGFQAVREYCKEKYDKKVILLNTIRKAIFESKECSGRRLRIKQEEKLLSLGEKIEEYTRYHDLYGKCKQIFANTEMENRIGDIVAILLDEPVKTKKVLYLNTLKRFGKKDGVITYRGIKQMLA